MTARGFGPEPRSSFATNTSVSWMNDRFAGKLSLNAFYGMQKDWKGEKRKALLWMVHTLPLVLGIGRQVLDNRKDGGVPVGMAV